MNEDKYHFWIVILYSVGLIIILAILSYVLWDKNDPRIMYVPVPILQWAFVGGVIGVLHRLAFDRRNIPNYSDLYMWAVAKPVVAIVMGAVVYFIAVSGELALNGSTGIKNVEFLNVLAFLGGFSDRFSVNLLNRILGNVETTIAEKHPNKQ